MEKKKKWIQIAHISPSFMDVSISWKCPDCGIRFENKKNPKPKKCKKCGFKE